MKPLSQMTREELWALDESEIIELAHTHDVDTTTMGYDPKRLCSLIISRPVSYIRNDLEQLRLELQKDNADSRQDR